jgi:hypothetical protein
MMNVIGSRMKGKEDIKGESPMSKALKTTFVIHAVVSFLAGAPLLIVPGLTLTLLGWAPIDPRASRVLGAALLALAWGSFRGWLAIDRARVAILIETEAVFTVLTSVGLLRHLLSGGWPLLPWLVFVVFLVFALAWICFLVRKE